MLQPDYSNSIVNLVASIVKALGGEPNEYAPLAGLQGLEVAGQPLVLLIADGLGDVFLRNFPDSFLCGQRKGRLTSVFPPTTASAVTSFFTGVAPQQHAITGWFTYFKELAAVAAVLPFTPRYGGASFAAAGISPAQLVAHASLLDRLNISCHVVLPLHLADSAYSRTLSGRAARHGYASLARMFACIENLAVPHAPALIIAYWAELDNLAHAHGMGSPEVAAHFLELDKGCRHSLPLLAERGATVLVSADHGLIDTSKAHTIHLHDHPELAATLTLPLCGEPRCAYCYVRSDRRRRFERYVHEKLDFACELRRSSDLIREGYFGKGAPSPRLEARIGEYVLMMKGNYVISDRLANEKQFHQTGVHGGFSEEELYVPLIVPGKTIAHT